MVCGVIGAARPERYWEGRWARYQRPGALGLIKAPRGDAVLVLVGGRSKRAKRRWWVGRVMVPTTPSSRVGCIRQRAGQAHGY